MVTFVKIFQNIIVLSTIQLPPSLGIQITLFHHIHSYYSTKGHIHLKISKRTHLSR